ncbi:LysR family transcriptional regulator [Vibrio gallaecicus]|uniref:LysR family transcriptional regulator n=1 Tax=Vibrio gallaecicus TaxID=552386 RepID=A0ABV4N8I9_9VIBR
MYNIEQLRMFVAAVELGSFSASARKLGKVQSAVSQGISNLEIDFDVQLFDRSTRKPTLTQEGEQLFKQVKAIVLQVEDLNVTVNAIGNNEEGLVRVAFDDALFLPSLAKILDVFSQTFPATEVDLISTSSTDVIGLIEESRADIGLMFTDLNFNMDTNPCFIGNLPFYAVCHPSHPLAPLDEAKVSDFILHRQLVLRGHNSGLIDQFPTIAGKFWWSTSFRAIKDVVLNSKAGWAYLPHHMVEAEIKNKTLVEINSSFDHKAWSPPVDLVTSKLQVKGPAQLWLEDKLKTLLD